MIVGQYLAKYHELVKYFRYLRNQPNEKWKSIQFEQVLRFDIHSKIRTLEIRCYELLVNKCLFDVLIKKKHVFYAYEITLLPFFFGGGVI